MRTKSLVTCLVGLVLLFASSSSAAEMRKWTRKNGKEFEAEFVKREGPVVTLKKPDGTEIILKMPGLSEEDRKYVKQLTKGKGKAAPKEEGEKEPAGKDEKPATPPEKKPDSADTSTEKPGTGEGLFVKVAAKREHEKQTVESLRTALEGFPLNCLKAEVAGDPEDVKHDQDKTTIRVSVRVQADVHKFNAFRKRLFAAVDKVATDKIDVDGSRLTEARGDQDPYFQFYLGPSGRRDLQQANRAKAERDRLAGTIPASGFLKAQLQKMKESDDLLQAQVRAVKTFYITHLLLKASTDRNEDWSKISWRFYAVDNAAQSTLCSATTRSCECRLSSVGAKGEAVLLAKFPVGLRQSWPQDEYRTLMTTDVAKTAFSICDIFLDEQRASVPQPALTIQREITMADSELKDLRKLTCELRFIESPPQKR